MSLRTLLSKLKNDVVTPCNPCFLPKVTEKTNEINDVPNVTLVTPKKICGEPKAAKNDDTCEKEDHTEKVIFQGTTLKREVTGVTRLQPILSVCFDSDFFVTPDGDHGVTRGYKTGEQGQSMPDTPRSVTSTGDPTQHRAGQQAVSCCTPAAGDTRLADVPGVTPTALGTTTLRPPGLSEKMLAASMALDAQQAGLPDDLPVTNGTWPHGPAWTASEIATYQSRHSALIAGGMSGGMAESVADASIFDDRSPGGTAKPVATPYTPTPAKQSPWAVTASWRPADRAYLNHHAHCPTCKVAGRRLGERCDTGAGLWRDYINAFNDWGRHDSR